MRYFISFLVLATIAVISIAGFRGSISRKPPLEIFPDMDRQARLKPQAEFTFFEDSRVDRVPVTGTVARGNAWDSQEVFSSDYQNDEFRNPRVYTGKNAAGDFVKSIPIEVDKKLLQLGQEKYNIFCIVCHGEAGDGKGITSKYGVVGNMNYHDKSILSQTDGELYNTIVNGKNLMLGYGTKLNAEERWAVVAYVRALQKAQNATIEDVPVKDRSKL